MTIPKNWKPLTSSDGMLIHYQRACGGYRVTPMYSGRWHSCERLTEHGDWLEWAGKEHLLAAMEVCGRHALAARDHMHANSTQPQEIPCTTTEQT